MSVFCDSSSLQKIKKYRAVFYTKDKNCKIYFFYFNILLQIACVLKKILYDINTERKSYRNISGIDTPVFAGCSSRSTSIKRFS